MKTPSNPNQVRARRILVAGDVCLDVVGVPITAKTAKTDAENWRLTGETRTHFLPGGAMLLAKLVRDAKWAAAQMQAEDRARKSVPPVPVGVKLDEHEKKERDIATARLIEDARRAVPEPTEDDVLGPRPAVPTQINEPPLKGESLTKHFLGIAERLRRDEIVHSLLALAEFPTTADKKDKTKTLRVEKEHGYSGPTKDTDLPRIQVGYPPDAAAHIILLDDTGNSFRRSVSSNPWPSAVGQPPTDGAKPLIIYKLHRPLPLKTPLPPPENLLWQAVKSNHSSNRLVILSVEDLRECGVPISRGLSWERTALDLVWHLINMPSLTDLRDCPRLIIRLGESGAIYWQQIPPVKKDEAASYRAWLIYDPGEIEGSFTARFDHRGRMVASGSAFTAALVQYLATAPVQDFKACLGAPAADDLEDKEPLGAVLAGIRAGLLASRRLWRLGFGTKPGEPDYPGPELFEPPGKKEAGFACRKIPIISGALQPDRGYWRLLDDVFTDAACELRLAVELTATKSEPEKLLRVDAPEKEIKEVAEAARNASAQKADPAKATMAAFLLSQAPIAVFADALRTYDRREIENYRALYSLLYDYVRLGGPKRPPLNVAVFGPPGAGKSFGVKQVAKALTELNPKRPITELTFNLSQYQTADELAAAFHLVRDLVLHGEIPLVFFDEFDTALQNQKLAWLRYFLAPMQDGLFLDRGALHPIGQAIFVFAGGTCDTYQEFAAHPALSDAEFKSAKGPDFLSRLRGALDIPSLNFIAPRSARPAARCDVRERIAALPAEVRGPVASPWPALSNIALSVMDRIAKSDGSSDAALASTFDPHGPIEAFPCEAAILLRRAGVLAYQLGLKGPDLKDAKEALHVRTEVLRAFLYLPQFVHGNRSLEALLDMSHLLGQRSFTPSLLPPDVNALLHANPAHLNQLVATEYPFPEHELGVIAEQIHEAYLEERCKANEFKPAKASHQPWAVLSDFYKNRNRESARAIPGKLRSVGLWFRKVGKPSGRYPLPDAEVEALIERLATDEHDRWVADQRRQGYAFGPEENHTMRHHPSIQTWTELSDKTKNQDRDTVRNIPRILAVAGYEVVKL